MTGRSGLTDGEHGDSRGYGRLLLVAVLVLAITATAMLVLSNDARFLRLGVLAALWAAMVGAFLAVKYRREAASREDEVSDLQAVYELELEREVAARREYELEIEAETRHRIEEESKEDLDALRGELRALRENLEALLGGEVLVERVALRAESTRMRSLSDQSRLLAVGDDRVLAKQEDRKGITAGARKEQTVDGFNAQTELIERIEQPVLRKETRGEAPRRPEPSRPEPTRQPTRNSPSVEAGNSNRAPSQARREPIRPQQRQPQPATQMVSRPMPVANQPVADKPRQPEPRETAVPDVVGMRVRPPEPRQPPPRQPEQVGRQMEQPTMAIRLSRQQRPAESRPVVTPPPVHTQNQPIDQPPSQPMIRQPVEEASRRRRPEPEPVSRHGAEAQATGGNTGGRRRRSEGGSNGPVWDPELGDWVSNSLDLPIPNRNGAPPHWAAVVSAPAAAPVDAGAHAAGKSVSELLAAYGVEEPTRRRRRRVDD